MGYCFMHFEKVKSFARMTNLWKHNLRIAQPANADPDKADLNEELIALDGATYREKWQKLIDEAYEKGTMNKHIRKDAVLGLEVVLTFSKSNLEQIDIEQWKKDNVEWLKKAFNVPGSDRNNVISAVYHGDESGNVHIHAFVVPIDDKGHLNAGYYTAGRRRCREMQSSYAKVMARHGLKRGLEGSVAKHEDIKKFYTELNQTFDIEKVPKPEPEEELEIYYGRVCKYVQECNMTDLQKEKQFERAAIEMQTSFNQELVDYRKKKREMRKKEKFIKELLGNAKEYGKKEHLSPNELEKRLKAFAALDNGLKHMEDQAHAQELREEMNAIIKEERQKEKTLDKEYEQTWDI